MPNEIHLNQLNKRLESARSSHSRTLTHIRHSAAGSIEQILCKLCGHPISGLVEDERIERTNKMGDRVILHRALVHVRYPNYRQIRILFDDDSEHSTHLCATCLNKGLTPSQLEILYCCDIAQWLHEDDQGLGPDAQNLFRNAPQLMHRKPKSYYDEKVELG
ncbi:MAG: hypothetical protein C5B59_17305 [Bacteroidetes bacterium]|nr:MAG: hypothetical protein C5B59_17305 [Bacteroidota bacterium]